MASSEERAYLNTIRATSIAWMIPALLTLIVSCQVVRHPVVETFPLHSEPLATDWGRYYKMGELALEGGCLRILGNPALSNRKEFVPSFLPIWPDGFSWKRTEASVAVVDGSGQEVAHVGDYVRLSGDGVHPERHRGRQLAESLANDCKGPYYLVGDDVTTIDSDEPQIVPVGDSDIYFRRHRTEVRGFTPVAEPAYGYTRMPRTLILEDDCILLQDADGQKYLPEWPAGFTAHLERGQLAVRNGGGRKIASVGEKLRTRGYIAKESEGGLYVPECTAPILRVWGVINADLPLEFSQHDGRWKREVEDTKDSLRGTIDVRNGCMHINNNYLLWPSDYRIEEEGDFFRVLDELEMVAAQYEEVTTLKGHRIRSDDKFGPEIIWMMPVDCPPLAYWIVTGHE